MWSGQQKANTYWKRNGPVSTLPRTGEFWFIRLKSCLAWFWYSTMERPACTCVSSWTDAESGSASDRRAIIVMRTILYWLVISPFRWIIYMYVTKRRLGRNDESHHSTNKRIATATEFLNVILKYVYVKVRWDTCKQHHNDNTELYG